MALFHAEHSTVSSTQRLEAYSDGVMAIIVTILVLELHVPELPDTSLQGVLTALGTIMPQLLSFAFSFLTVSVFWVNHHHFYHELDRADGRMLWINNALLFWLSLVPFTTAFIGDHSMVPGVIMLYCFVLFCAAFSFMMMSRHAMNAKLLHDHIPLERQCRHYSRSKIGVAGYALATISAAFFTPLSVLLIIAIPVYFIAPRLMHDHDASEQD